MMSDVLAFGGGDKFFYLLVTHLDRERFSPHLFVPKEGVLTDRLRELDFPLHVRRLHRPQDLMRLPWFLGYLRRHGIRLINAHGCRAAVFAALARCVLPVRVVVTEQNLPEWRTSGGLLAWIDRFSIRHNDFRIAVAKAIRDSLVEPGLFPGEKTRVIHNAIEPERFSVTPAQRATFRQQLGLSADDLAVVAAGRLIRMKGFDVLIRAAPAILADCPRAKVFIAGSGEEQEALAALVRQLDLVRHVQFLGLVQDMPGLFAATDVFVLPSVEAKGQPREGLPLVLIEALAAECPVVTTDVSGNREVILHEETGLVVPQKDPVALAHAIVRLLHDPDRAHYGKRGRQLVEREFSLETVVAQYMDVFEELLTR